MLCVKSFFILPFSFAVFANDQDITNAYIKSIPFGSPNNNWIDIGVALSIIAFSICPIFIFVSTFITMKNRKYYKIASILGMIPFILMYIVVGEISIYYWGYNVQDPITNQIPRGGLAIAANIILFVTMSLDYIMASLLVTHCFGENTKLLRIYVITFVVIITIIMPWSVLTQYYFLLTQYYFLLSPYLILFSPFSLPNTIFSLPYTILSLLLPKE